MNGVLKDALWPLWLVVPVLVLLFARVLYCALLAALGRRVPADAETRSRGQSLLLGQALRQAYAWALAPVVDGLLRIGAGPNTLTVLCLALSTLAGVFIALGAVTLGGMIGLLGASFDYLDGRLARLRGPVTRSGGFLDSTLDRYGEVAFLSGAALLFRDSFWTLGACLVAVGSGGIVSYTRAKAEALGVALGSGLMQRPERVALFYAGACFGSVLDFCLPDSLQGRRVIFAAVLYLLAALTLHTSIQRTLTGFSALRRAERERTDA